MSSFNTNHPHILPTRLLLVELPCHLVIFVTFSSLSHTCHIFPTRLSLRRRSTTLSPLCVRRTSNRLVLAGPPIIFTPYDYHDFHVLPSYWILASPPIIMVMLKKETCQRNTNHKVRPDHNTVTGSCWKILIVMNGRKVVIYIIFLAQALL